MSKIISRTEQRDRLLSKIQPPKYDLIVFIGRFQPFSEHHKEIIRRAMTMGDELLILVGSSFTRRTTRNPLTFEERESMIHEFIDRELAAERANIHINPQRDRTYNDTAWSVDVSRKVNGILQRIGTKRGWYSPGQHDFKVGIIGHKKDETTTHLEMFPQYELIDVGFIDAPSASEIRQRIFESFEGTNAREVIMRKLHVHYNVAKKLETMYREEKEYRERWGCGPFLTADSIVQVGDNVLLIKRGDGGGWALPGGFLEPNETFLQGAIRELKEETRLKVPIPVLKGSIKNRRVFDDPHRSTRARIITEAFHFHLVNDKTLPEVRGSDDADEAFWCPISQLEDKEEMFFDDHWHILMYMLGI